MKKIFLYTSIFSLIALLFIISSFLYSFGVLPTVADFNADRERAHKQFSNADPDMLSLLQQADNNNGYQSLFDGKSLNGWRGIGEYWRAENSELIGQSPDGLKQHQYLVSENKYSDFALKFDFRVDAEGFANTGIFYRVNIVNEEELFINGYQADIDFIPWLHWAGAMYDERGYKSYGKMLSYTGQRVWVDGNDGRIEIDRFGDADDMASYLQKSKWFSYTVVAKGGRLIHRIDDTIYSDVIIADNVRKQGFLAWQLHQGPAMTARFRNIRIKVL